MLNRIWLGFFLAAFAGALWQWLVQDNTAIFATLTSEAFAMAKLSVDIALGLVGLLCLWLGLLKIADHAGLTAGLSRLLAPLFGKLFPEIPRGHPALGSMAMNSAANLLGLDNAATPIGLRAMQELQSLNPLADTASRAQILFMVLNTASLTLFPVTVMMYRAQSGASDPAAVFLPILGATACGTCVGLGLVAWRLRLPVLNRVVGAYVLAALGVIALMLLPVFWLPHDALTGYSSALGNGLLLAAIASILLLGARNKVDLFDSFIAGAKEGFALAIQILPYLVAMLVAIGLLRASGVLDLLLDGVRYLVATAGGDTAFVDALPTGIMKMLSGSGARAMMLETMRQFGPDSFAALTSAVMQGSSETTFYVLAVYAGSVGLKKLGPTLMCAVLADVACIVAAVLLSYAFFA
ncbi:hypothetical protein HPT27_08440 [Permianibacter sp. IMCC34836]|uniref:nucleoside recognition domain-containing protein n=1 Tax=Permianibacter fluminis TaxID=2738515 RepID=UPI0015531294|nr:nucleoside recognition domain-containing protein [Permianibacter fluminis]NQD37050.1 hypothetical protein [Permianibacter fluminis]